MGGRATATTEATTVSPQAPGRSFSRGFSREVGRSLSRGFSRGLSTDSIFDPSTYVLEPVTEDEKRMELQRQALPRNVPAKQQMGERPGTKTSFWQGKIFTSRDNIEYGVSEEEEDSTIKKSNSFYEYFFKKNAAVAPVRK